MSRRNIYIIGGLLLVVIVAGYWFFLLSPIRADIATTNTALAAEQAKQQATRVQLASMHELQKQAAANQAALIELAKMMPAAKEVPSLLIQIQDLATEAGIDFMTITPGKTTAGAAYGSLPLSLQFTGTFFDINDFLYRVEQLVAGPGRLLAVQSVDLSLLGAAAATTRTSPTLTAAITIDAFQFVPAATPDAPGGAASPTKPGTAPAGTNTAAAPGSPGQPTS
jgi:Tfp pilus assembly protein PilO